MTPTLDVADIDPADAEQYLRARGWELVHGGDWASRWRLASLAGRRTLVVPISREPDDFLDVFRTFVLRLAEVEARDPSEVVIDLRNVVRDILRLRIVTPRAARGEVPLAYGAILFAAARDLVSSAARTAATGSRAVYPGRPPVRVTQLLNDVSLGQTAKGSYVVTLLSPAERQMSLEFGEAGGPAHEAFERTTVRRLLAATAVARDAANREGVLDEDALDEEIELGLSANLCEALARMSDDEVPATVHLQVTWAAVQGIPDAPDEVTLSPGELARLRTIGAALRRLSPRDDFVLRGWVESLKFDGLGEKSGQVTLKADIEGRQRSVRVELEDEAFLLAKRLAGEGFLTARGTLEKAGRYWVLTDPRDITVG
jgi:hypothetical protein